MPTLHRYFRGKATQPDGKEVDLPPSFVLTNRGPVLQVSIAIADQIAAELAQQGKTVEPPIFGLALIDTGASNTCIDEEAAMRLKLPIIDVGKIASASHAAHPANIYPVRLEIAGPQTVTITVQALGSSLAAHGLVALIGRDALAHGTLFYNDLAGEITLSIL